MRVQRTVHTSAFVVIPNAIAQHPTLSLAARGLAVMLLSLADGIRINVRDISAMIPGLGRVGAANALDELEAAGFYVRRTYRTKWGRLVTETAIFDTPQIAGQDAPVPAGSGVGERAVGRTGTPLRGKNQEKETTPLPTLRAKLAAGERIEDLTALEGGREGESSTDNQNNPGDTSPMLDASSCGDANGGEGLAVEGQDRKRGDDKGNNDGTPPAVEDGDLAAVLPLFGRVRQADARLSLSKGEMGKLAPLVAEWRSRGASDLMLVEALTAGLPAQIHAPARLIADRLARKMPERPVSAPENAPAARTAMTECPGCERPSRTRGLCVDCRTAEPAGASLAERATARGASLARELLAGLRTGLPSAA
ncbi:hypothetical protein AB0G06_02090 [Nonomuraea dietziae]|uniref:hypothetical protein n=1 Tax=Nonomuraea dietziae TaxID=65515 RepID=UPI0033CDF161